MHTMTSSTRMDTVTENISEKGVDVLPPTLIAPPGHGKKLLRFWPDLQPYDPSRPKELEQNERIAIRWGDYETPARRGWQELNSQRSLRRLAQHDEASALLRTNRIPVRHADEGPRGVYRILVIDQNICITAKRGIRSALAPAGRKARAERLAARAVYCLGLDFAQVDIGVFALQGEPVQLAVTRINPVPKLGKMTLDRFLISMHATVEQLRQEELLRREDIVPNQTLMFGADPEFALRSRKTMNMLMASKFFPFRGRVGHDARPIGKKSKKYPLVEIRCPAGEDPRAVFSELARSLRIAHRKLSHSVEWLAGSQPFSGVYCGGHVHVSGIRLNRRLVRALDHYLGVPLLLCEQPTAARQRRVQYGFLGDVRLKDHGGFEYRSPASWLVTPEYAYATIVLVWLIARNYPKLRADWLWSHSAQRAYYEADDAFFLPHVESLYDDLAALPEFDEVADILDWFFDRIAQRKKWPEDRNFRYHWFPRSVGHRRRG